MIGKLAVSAVLLTMSVSAFASHWYDLGTTTMSKESLDVDSIRSTGHYVTVWQKTSYNAPVKKYDEKPWLVSKTLAQYKYDCAARKQAIQSFADYDANGLVLTTATAATDDWSPVTPDSIGDGMLQVVCPK